QRQDRPHATATCNDVVQSHRDRRPHAAVRQRAGVRTVGRRRPGQDGAPHRRAQVQLARARQDGPAAEGLCRDEGAEGQLGCRVGRRGGGGAGDGGRV
ncbi:hypothetical protein LTR60_002047, partial [Cryomyces antarcticus]